MPVPRSFRNHARLTLLEMKYLLFAYLELSSKEDVDSAFEQIEELVLFGMHFPFVTYPGRIDRENTHPATVELHG